MKKLLLSLIFIVSFSSLTFALTFVVNNNGDTNDANTADNLCADTSGNCTLRAAIQQANVSASDDIIEFSSAVFNTAQTITLTNGELEINNAGRLTINGSGANLLQISGNNQSRIFFITQNATVDINNVTLTQGNGRGSLSTNTGGAIFNNGGVINLQNTVITGNSTGSGGSDGGGIYNTFAGTVTLTNSTVTNNIGNAGGGISSIGGFIDVVNSTISNNSAFAGGGLSTYNLRVTNSTIANNIAVRGGGVYVNFGTATIANSTISGNTATGDSFRDAEGGGIYVDRETLVINNATITNNTSSSTVSRGGGIFTTSDTGTQTFIRNTIVAANIISGGTSQDIFKGGASILTSDGNNLIGNNTGAETSFPAGNPNANGDKVGTTNAQIDPKLGALQNNGGQTATHALLAGSPAVDSGNNCVVTATCPSNNPPFPLTTDQRGAGFSRQVDGNSDGIATVDIGAYEASAPATANFTVNLTTDQHDANVTDGICDIDLATAGLQCTLRAAVEQANAFASNDLIMFSSLLANSTITLTIANGGEIPIENNGSLTINGLGANLLTIDGGTGDNRIFYGNQATVTITGVTLTGGNGTGANISGSGGAIYADRGTVILNSVHVTANSTTGFTNAGGINFAGGINHQIINSTVSNNTANSGCGGFLNNGTLTVINSTISGNSAIAGEGGGFCVGNNTILRNVTIFNNSAGNSAGIYQFNGTLNIGSTIVAGNTGGARPDIGFTGSGTVTTAGYNLIGDNQSVETTFPAGNPNANQDIVGTSAAPVNPMLDASLRLNGGTTPTHALLPGSLAIDKGNSFGSTTDQRGLPRPVNQPSITEAIGGDGSDIGAFEVQLAPTAANVTIGGKIANANGRGIFRAIVTLTDANGELRFAYTNPFGYYRFNDVAAGNTYILAVRHKSYAFTPQVLSIVEDYSDLNFRASEGR